MHVRICTCIWFSGECVCVCEFGCVWANGGVVVGVRVKREREIHSVLFPLLPHYKTLGLSECTDELQ